tara:strand:- start:2354 stop:2989 length:636 start_codon:yes stop_codon:yes gene_type:complete
MSEIFISYASEDESTAKQLANTLESYGWHVWWDHRIPPGKDYANVIEVALKKAQCIIVLWSKESVTSRWVKNEAAEGIEKGMLVPALIEAVEIPFEFRRIQAANLVDWQPANPNEQFDFFIESISAILQAPPPNPTPKKPKPEPSVEKKNQQILLSLSQRHKGYLAGAGFCALTGLTSISEGMTWGDDEMLLGGLFFLGLTIFLWGKSSRS